jgi:hypothetical protein
MLPRGRAFQGSARTTPGNRHGGRARPHHASRVDALHAARQLKRERCATRRGSVQIEGTRTDRAARALVTTAESIPRSKMCKRRAVRSKVFAKATVEPYGDEDFHGLLEEAYGPEDAYHHRVDWAHHDQDGGHGYGREYRDQA